MLTKTELGQAIGRAIQLKIEKGFVKSKAEIARHFQIKPPSLVDWVKRGSISKEKWIQMITYFSDVVPLSHWYPEGTDPKFFEADREILMTFEASRVNKQERHDALKKQLLDSDPSQVGDVARVPGNAYGLSIIDIPVLNVVEWLTLDEMFGPDMTQSERDRMPKTFGLKINDDTNSPRLNPGQVVEINTERPAKSGDFVLARCEAGAKPTIKKLVLDGGSTFLTPHNTRYEVITPKNLEILGVVQRRIDIEEF